MKRRTFKLALAAVSILILASAVTRAQTAEPKIEVRVTPATPVEERVANDLKEKELRKAAEEKRNAEEAARIAAASPKGMLSRAQILLISSNTDYFEPVQLQNALRKRSEIEAWQIVMTDGWRWDQRNLADTYIEIDRPLFTFTFTYKITNRNTGILLATGKVTAFDGNAAAPMLAERIVDEIRKARGEAKPKK